MSAFNVTSENRFFADSKTKTFPTIISFIPFRIMNSSITNSIALSPMMSESMIRNREGILPDYTRQGKSTLPSRWSTAGNIVQKSKQLQMTDESKFGNNSIQVSLDYSSELKDSIRTIILDGKSTDGCRDRNEFIDFYLKIPPKELRLQRENSKERLKCSIHLNKKTTKKKGKSIIERLLSDVDNQMMSDSFQINVIQCRKSSRT